MFDGFEEITDQEVYDKAMAGDKPAVLLMTHEGNKLNNAFYMVLIKFQKLYGDEVNFYYLDTSKNTIAEDIGVFTFPTVLYFRDTMELERHDYLPSEEEVEKAIRRLLRK
ncbi:MAG: thioredoxin [Aquificaceae bacterium]